MLYGLDLAKRDISRGRQVVVVEGYTDVMACHLAGVTTAVATCGTSFGIDHIKVVRRMLGDVENANTRGLGEVVFTFDPDMAGQNAASRAFSEEQRFAAQTFVAVAPDGLDPCDLRLKKGDDAVRRLVDSKKPMFAFMIRRVMDAYNLETAEGRVAALRAAAPIVASIRDQALNIEYVRDLAKRLGMDPAEVGRTVRAVAGRASVDASRAPGSGGQGGEATQPGGPVPERAPSISDLPRDLVTRLERDAIMAILQHPEAVGRPLADRAVQVAYSNASLAVVRDGIAVSMDAFDSTNWLDRVIEEVPQPFATLVKELGVAPIPVGDAADLPIYCAGVTSALIDKDLVRRKRELLGQLQRLDALADPTKSREIQQQLVVVEQERRLLRDD